MMSKIYRSLCFRKVDIVQLFFLFILCVLMMVSCKVTQSSSYFKNLKKDTTLAGSVTSDFELKIMKGDRLSIAASSLSTAEDALFNSAGSVGVGGSSAKAGGYVVQEDGTVLLHRPGTVQAAGTTRKELSRKLEERLLA
jgi:protein involved in polysaccharide export with SLBB domain